MSPDVAGFRPSTSGFRFENDWPTGTPALALIPAAISLPGGRSVTINDASNGLCGGMAFAAIDYFAAGLRPPTMWTAPGPGEPLFRFIVERLLASWNLPAGPLRYWSLMSPALSDGRVWWKPWTKGRAAVMAAEWAAVKADLDAGKPSPLGLIRVRSFNPGDLKHHHQVVAWGYELDGDVVTVRLYDPNHPLDDDVTMRLSLADPSRPIAVEYTPADPGYPVLCFFRVPYRPTEPPPAQV
jgi:hypothetical protein